MTKENVLEALKELGFKCEYLGEIGYGFSYEGTNYLYMYNPNDENFLQVAIHRVYELSDGGDEMFLYRLMDQVNSSLKYTKAYTVGDSVWLFYEREIIGDEDYTKLLSCIITHLDQALFFALRTIKKMMNNPGDGDGGTYIPVQDDGDESPEE